MHEIGFLHLDIKPDNILLMSANRTKPDSSSMILIDFGLSGRFLDQFGQHVENVSAPFVGNVLFASKNTYMQ